MSAFRPQAVELLAFNSDRILSLSPASFRFARPIGGMRPFHAAIKRLEDLVLTALFLAVALTPMVAIALVIRLTSKGPVLFRQERVGLDGQPFVMLKFRTMREAPETPGVCPQARRDDPRVTRFGSWLRRTSFDELPQLFNVIAGSMSLVGPRPHAPGTCAAGRPFEAVSDLYAARHCVKPGMTGLAQIRGWRGETDTEEKLLRRIDSDLEYIATWSLGRDLAIIVRTIATVLRMPNAY